MIRLKLLIPTWLIVFCLLLDRGCLLVFAAESDLETPCPAGGGGLRLARGAASLYRRLHGFAAKCPRCSSTKHRPIANELALMSTIPSIFDWLGSLPQLQQGFFQALGGETQELRDIVFTKGSDWNHAVSTVQVPTTASTSGEGQHTTDTRAPTPIEQGHLSVVRRIPRLRLGLTAKEQTVNSGSIHSGHCHQCRSTSSPRNCGDDFGTH